VHDNRVIPERRKGSVIRTRSVVQLIYEKMVSCCRNPMGIAHTALSPRLTVASTTQRGCGIRRRNPLAHFSKGNRRRERERHPASSATDLARSNVPSFVGTDIGGRCSDVGGLAEFGPRKMHLVAESGHPGKTT
jgi:hypothetical protein